MKPTFRVLAVACVVALAVAMMPAVSMAQGCASCAAPVAVAPTYTSYYAPTSYMPGVVYRAMYSPTVTTAYMPVAQPAVAYAPVTSYAVSTYRPLFSWNYRTRLVPYTTYQPVYTAAPVVASPVCSTCVGYSPCNSCVGYDSCSSGACGTVSYVAPASGCSSCTAAPTTVTPAPQEAAPPKTFQENVQKPEVQPEPELKPIPQTETHLNSMPAPLLPDLRDRTASRNVYPSIQVSYTSPAASDDGWQPARD